MTSAKLGKTLLIVDPSVQDYRSLTEHLTAEADVLVLDADRDGVAQITAALDDRRSIRSLHLLSHGSPGTLYLGTANLSLTTLSQYSQQIRQWISALTEQAEVLLYGCEVAAGNVGQLFIQKLSHLTGASIAASTTRIGNAALGGDWTLDAAVGAILSPSIFSDTAMADFQNVLAPVVFVDETFTRSTVTNPFWTSGFGAETVNPVAPFLTAGLTTTAIPPQVPPNGGGLPGNPLDVNPATGVPDPEGQGVLRLTNANFDQAGFVLYNQPINSQAGLSITFDMFQWGGTSRDGNVPGGDGITFFLIDGSTPFSDQAGAFGGSLGYAQKTGIPGVDGGYLGVGFDVFGNFSNPTEGRVGGPGPSPNTIVVRGSEETEYQFLTNVPFTGFSLNNVAATSRNDPGVLRTVQITLTGDGNLTVSIDQNGDRDVLDAGETVISNFDTTTEARNGDVPAAFKFGFAAGTGSSTAFHEIRNLQVTTLTAPPLTNNASLVLPINTAANVPGLGGTDTDGTIVAFQVLTVPTPDQGTLFVGNPAAGGIPLTAGQTLTPEQIGQVFFQSSGNFTGSSFTYTAIDQLGGTSLQPGVVSLGLQPIGPGPGPGPSGPNLPPNTLGATFDLPQNTLSNLPGLGATDPNPEDTIASFTILTVPDPAQGTLFLGLPSADGRPVTAGQIIPADDIGQLFFQSSNNFTGGSFTYAATDSQGLTDPTPATVGLSLITLRSPDDCEPGIRLRGNRRNNRLAGTADNDTLIGFRGNDRLIGRGCNDRLDGSRGNDRLRGGDGRDTLRGQQNNDQMDGGNGIDRLEGGLGNDSAFGGRGRDTLRGGRGNDRLRGQFGDDNIEGGRGRDRIRGGANLDILEGQQGNDLMFGENGIDFINTGLGDDRAVGGRRADTVYGRRGRDRLEGNGDTDRLFGNRGDDRLIGGSQADRILGGFGRDTIIGGGGADVLSGGGGQDTFVYRSASQGFDQILDFRRQDRMDLSGVFRGSSYSSSNRFQRYVRLRETSGGTIVRVDSNGNAAGGFVRLAILEGTTPGDLSAANFIVS